MFCSSCKRVDLELHGIKRRICNTGHIFCTNCDENFRNCIICDQKISNFIHVEFNESIPRMYCSLDLEATNDDENIMYSNTNENDNVQDLDSSLNEIMNELNEYENCCDKADCEKKPIVGCVQVIGHKLDDVSVSIILDDQDEREIFNNFYGAAEASKSSTQERKTSTGTIRKTKSYRTHSKKSDDLNTNSMASKTSVKNSRSTCFGDHNESLIVNKSSTREIFSETHHSCLSFTTRSECYGDDVRSISEDSNPISVCQIYRNEDIINESETANFTSLSASRNEASPPEGKKDSKIPSIACRAKFAPVYECDYKFPAQMEPIEYFDPNDVSESKESVENLAINLPRLPITCPCSFCGMITTPSDFSSHITIDHPYIETVKLVQNKVINITFCPSGNINFVRCHQMFLLSGKLSGIGYGPFKNCLPILLLSCKFNLHEIFGSSTISNQQYQKSDEVLCIWLTSVYQFPVNYSLNVWKHGKDMSEQNFIKSISTVSSCLNIKETNLHIVTSVLNLTTAEYGKVKDDENMIHCQVVFN